VPHTPAPKTLFGWILRSTEFSFWLFVRVFRSSHVSGLFARNWMLALMGSINQVVKRCGVWSIWRSYRLGATLKPFTAKINFSWLRPTGQSTLRLLTLQTIIIQKDKCAHERKPCPKPMPTSAYSASGFCARQSRLGITVWGRMCRGLSKVWEQSRAASGQA